MSFKILFFIFSLTFLVWGHKLHLANEAKFDCFNSQSGSLKCATIPILSLYSQSGDLKNLRNVQIDPKISDLLILSNEQCKKLELTKFAGISEIEGKPMKTYEGKVKFTDMTEQNLAVEGRVKIGCAEKIKNARIGLDGVLAIMALEVRGDNVYSNLYIDTPERTKILRMI